MRTGNGRRTTDGRRKRETEGGVSVLMVFHTKNLIVVAVCYSKRTKEGKRQDRMSEEETRGDRASGLPVIIAGDI